MPILPGTEAPTFELPGARIAGLASRSRGADEVTTYRVQLDAGAALPSHHHSNEEVFTILAGDPIVVVGDEERRLAPGDTVVVPAGVQHTLRDATSDVDLVAAVLAGTTFAPEGGEERIAPWAQ